MILFHVHITSTFPLAVPLEWNVFMIFGILFLFGHYGDVPLSTLDDPLLIAILAVICVGIPVLGNFRPDMVSFLPSMRYYAGNWATSQWLFRKDSGAEEKLDRRIIKAAPIVDRAARRRSTSRDLVDVLLYKGLAFRSMHSHGRALNGARCRARSTTSRTTTCARASWSPASSSAGTSATATSTTSSCSTRSRSAARSSPGELRVVTLESQPAHVQRQRYRIYDAATACSRRAGSTSPTWSRASPGSRSHGSSRSR